LHYAVAVAAIVVAAIALFGWGCLIRQLTLLSVPGWPLTIGLGLGGIIFLGGLCNLFGIARPLVLDGIVVLGIGLAALQLRHRPAAASRLRQTLAQTRWQHLVLLVILLAVGGFVIATELPPVTFNHHDDFEKYIPQVVRMLATGTVHDNPLGSIGIETLGGQAVLQGFIAANFPIAYINGADALFCLLLSLLIVGGLASERPASGLLMVSAVLAVLAIDPRYVNIAGLYSIVALSLALVAATGGAPRPEPDRSRIEAIVGLLYAAQIAVKLTAVSFVGLHFICWIAGTAWLCRDWRFAARRGLKTALWSVVFLLPWIALFAPDYVAILAPPFGSPALPKVPDHPPQFASPFSIDAYLPVAWYSAVAAIVLCCGCVVYFYARRLPPQDASRARAAALAAFCVAVTANYVFCVAYIGPYLADIEGATRYAAPWLIAGIGAALTLTPAFLPGGIAGGAARKAAWALACGGLAVVLMFGRSLQQRIGDAALYGMPQSYVQLWSPEARQAAADAMADAFHGKLHDDVHDAQSKVPAGSPIVAWMVAPFLLDYQRNPIYEVGWYQLVRPWTLIPQTRYVIWQYSGFGVRQPPEYAALIRGGIPMLAQASVAALQFGNQLQQIWTKSEVLYNDGGIVVLRVTCPRGLAQC
jgi:hypothetical protein